MVGIRIAFFSKQLPSDSPNGVSCQVHRLANGLVERGHDVTCHSFSPKPGDAHYAYRKLSYGSGAKVARKFAPAFEFARQHTQGYDVLHYHGDDFLCAGSSRRVRTFYGSALQEARNARRPARFLYQSLFYIFELVSCLRRGEKIGISRTTCESLPCVHTFIPCGVPLDLYRPAGGKTDFPSILFLGDLGSRKRGSFLLNVFASHILPKYPESQLTIVGPEPVRAEHVRYVGTVDESALVEEYNKAWVYCLVSSYEGFGVPAIEAMACGATVVAVDNPGTREVVHHEHNGLLASAEAFADNLDRALGDRPLRLRLAANGLCTVRDSYDIRSIAERYEQVYNRLGAVKR